MDFFRGGEEKTPNIFFKFLQSFAWEYVSYLTLYLFHDGGPYHIKTSPFICRANQWTGFYVIGTSVMKELNYVQRNILMARCYLMSRTLVKKSQYAIRSTTGLGTLFWLKFYAFRLLSGLLFRKKLTLGFFMINVLILAWDRCSETMFCPMKNKALLKSFPIVSVEIKTSTSCMLLSVVIWGFRYNRFIQIILILV